MQNNPFLTQLFSVPLLSGNSNNSEIRDKICNLAYEFKNSRQEAGLVSHEWDKHTITNDLNKFDEYGVTSYYSKNLVKEVEWQEASNFILDFARTMLSTVCEDTIGIGNMWTTIYPQNAHVPLHIHDNGLLSGVFYAKADKDCGDIVFEDPAYIAKTMRNRGLKNFPSVNTKYTYPVKAGDMIIFPSWLPHQTYPNKSGEDRIIISFNITFPGDAKL